MNVNSAYDLFLTRSLKHATLVRSEDGAETFLKEKLEAAGGVKQALQKFIAANPGRAADRPALHGDPPGDGHRQGQARGRRLSARFIEEMKASGFVADALKRSGQHDATVAPAEK